MTLEKLGQREEALRILKSPMGAIPVDLEIRVRNNLGIIQKRQGQNAEAEASYQAAAALDPSSFFP